MTIEQFYQTLNLIIDLDKELGLQSALDSVTTAVTQLASTPNQPQQQNALAAALSTLSTGAKELKERLSPAENEAIEGLGGAEFFDPVIADNVQASISANAMTPAVARAYVSALSTKRTDFLNTVKETARGLGDLGVEQQTLAEGSADLAFVIPRELFKNELGSLAVELQFISRLMGHVSEALTGSPESVQLETLSSSVPTIALFASLPVIASIATIVGKFLDSWEKIEKIRKIRAELSDVGITSTALDELTERITTTVNEVVEESTEITIRSYKGESTRKNELKNAIRQDAQRLFGQIERGLTIQFRAEPKEDVSNEEKKAIETIERAGRLLHFPRTVEQPILLTSGEVLDGEIEVFKVVKKTKTEKTTTTEKKPAKHVRQSS